MKRKLFNRIIELSGQKILNEMVVGFRVGDKKFSIDATAEMQKIKERFGKSDAHEIILGSMRILKSDNDGYWDNDGIGSYEYWGARGYDKGTDYWVPESCFVEAESETELSPMEILVCAWDISGENEYNHIGEAIIEMFTSDRNPDKEGYYSFEDADIALQYLEEYMKPTNEHEVDYLNRHYSADAKFKFEYADGVLKVKVFADYKDR